MAGADVLHRRGRGRVHVPGAGALREQPGEGPDDRGADLDHTRRAALIAGAVPAADGPREPGVPRGGLHHGPAPLRARLHPRGARYAAPGLLSECGIVAVVPDGAECGIAAAVIA